jgi:Bifunctional DNA primase/polymerase, N-terminal
MTSSELYQLALTLLHSGLSILPSGGGEKGKSPLIEWKNYEENIPTEEELAGWYKRFDPKLWGCVTGSISKVAVFDCDSGSAMDVMGALKPHVRTPRGGGHYWFTHPGHHVPTVQNLLPEVDVRGDGGFVNLIGGKYRIEIMPTNGSIYPWEHLPDLLREALEEAPEKSQALGTGGEEIPPGTQDSWLYHRACGYRGKGDSVDIIIGKLQLDIQRCPQKPGRRPYDDNDFKRIAESACKHPPGSTPNNGTFNNTFLNAGKNTENNSSSGQKRDKSGTNTGQIDGRDGPQKLSTSFDNILKEAGRMSKRDIAGTLGVSVTHDSFRKLVHRRINDDKTVRFYRGSSEILEWVNRDYKILSLEDYRKQANLSITLPLGLNKLVTVPPGSVIGIAGYTSGGKTSFLYETGELNIGTQDMSVFYWFNEMSEERMLLRLEDYPKLVVEMGKQFKAVKQGDFEFYDVIDPDAINIIDYLDLDGDSDGKQVWMIGAVIRKLQQQLGKGIVIFALQKKKDQDTGYGGVYSMKLSNLYLSMDIVKQDEKSMMGKCKIIKAKDWKEVDYNPAGLYCNYYTGGKHGKLISDNLWRRE